MMFALERRDIGLAFAQNSVLRQKPCFFHHCRFFWLRAQGAVLASGFPI